MQRGAAVLRATIFTRHLAQRPPPPPLLNDGLRHLRRVRLISETGTDCGEMTSSNALTHARDAGLDLMQVKPGGPAEAAVVRLVDYATLSEQRKKNAYEARRKGKETRMLDRREGVLKQVRLSPATDVGDRKVKMRQAKDFLLSGYRVKVYIQFRRGQGKMQENAKTALMEAARELGEFGVVQGVRGKDLDDLFKKEEGDEQGEVKKKPLEILLHPLPRKTREALGTQESHD